MNKYQKAYLSRLNDYTLVMDAGELDDGMEEEMLEELDALWCALPGKEQDEINFQVFCVG